MTISPAILVKNPAQLRHHLQRYLAAGIRSIDIDIQETPFASNSTLPFAEAFSLVQNLDLPEDVILGWDLKLADPRSAVEQIIDAFPDQRIYVYQNVQNDYLVQNIQFGVAIAVMGDDELRDLDFYQQFPEVQIMSVESETQGAEISAEDLSKVTRLREMGYTGLISIDGGVHLETAELIKNYPIDRVSVGSYFQQSDDVGKAYEELKSKLF